MSGETPIAIQCLEQARCAAECVFDWTDCNLSSVEAADMDVEWSQKAYEAARALVDALTLKSAA
jgi:hypothetical protein